MLVTNLLTYQQYLLTQFTVFVNLLFGHHSTSACLLQSLYFFHDLTVLSDNQCIFVKSSI